MSRLIVEVCGTLNELSGVLSDRTGTCHVVDLGKIGSIGLEACILMVKRNYNNAEARALSHRLILLVLKSTNEHNVAEENVTGGESGTDSLDVVTAATTTPSGDVIIA